MPATSAPGAAPDVVALLPDVYTEDRRIMMGLKTETLHYACADPEEPTVRSEHDTLLGAVRDFGAFAQCCLDASGLPLKDLGTVLQVIGHDRTQPLKAPMRALAALPARLHPDLARLTSLLGPAVEELDALARRHAHHHGPELLALLAVTRGIMAGDTLYLRDDDRSLRFLIRDITGRSTHYGLPLTLTQAGEIAFFTKRRDDLTRLTRAYEYDRRTGPSLLVHHASLRPALGSVNPVYAHALEHYALEADAFLLPGNLLSLTRIVSGARILELTPEQALALEDPVLRETLVTLLHDGELDPDVMFEVALRL